MGLYGRQWVYELFINVLCMFSIKIVMVHKPGSVIYKKLMIINLEQMLPFVSSSLPEKLSWNWLPFLFDLAPKRVCLTFFVTKKVVSSYLTISPLPLRGGILSVALSLSLHLPGVTWFFFQWSPDFPLDFSSDHRTIKMSNKSI